MGNRKGQRTGTIFYGFYSFITPWAPGSPSFKCVANPVQRMGNLPSGGTAGQCNGELRVDFNNWMNGHPGALGGPFAQGQAIRAQGWYRDPAAPGQTNLSDAITVTLCGVNAVPCTTGLVVIPPGIFEMGSSAANGTPYYNEYGWSPQPVHSVSISYPFWIGATEVTQAQYAALMGANPSHFPGSNRPVEQVSWFDAQAYCAALTAQQSALGIVPLGYQYRLPTEAEWEYACRAGTTTEFSDGTGLFCFQANFANSQHSNTNCGVGSTTPVGSYTQNPWGLWDMHGNVFEWCLDSVADYNAGAAANPFVTGGPERVMRGGAWNTGSYDCRSAVRYFNPPGVAYQNLGFRVALAPVLVP